MRVTEKMKLFISIQTLEIVTMSEKILDIPESDHKDLVNTNKIKKLTGDDVLYARELNPDEKTVPPFPFQFRMILTCNNVPFIPQSGRY